MAKATSETIQINSLPEDLLELALQHHKRTLTRPMKEWKERKHIPPVLLLTGQPGIGKRAVAHFLARWILCENKSDLNPCEKCSPCQKTKMRNELNLLEITSNSSNSIPQFIKDEAPTQSLKIDQFRKLKASAGFSAPESTHKIILIPDSERMTHQAANSILKLLEEPPVGWLFFLTASDPTLLLPTLVSRCQIFRLKPFSSEQIQSFLETAGVDLKRREICARLSQGSWSRALLFATDEMWERRKNFFQFFKDPCSVIHSLVDWAAQESSHFEALLDLFEQVTSDLIRWSAVPSGMPGFTALEDYLFLHSDRREELITHAQELIRSTGSVRMAHEFWMNRAERLAQARQESTTPVNRKLLIQDLLLPWIGVLS